MITPSKNIVSSQLNKWIFLISIYIALLFAHGYVFGTQDQMDFLPYALHLQQKALFAGDFYIDCMVGQVNERWVLAHLFALVPEKIWPYFTLLLHAICSLILIRGLKKFCEHFLLPIWIQWAVLGSTLILFYHRHLGGNELYYNMVTPSLVAKCMGIWSLWFAFRQSKTTAAIWCIAATYIHPIVGIQILMLDFILIKKKGIQYFLLPTILGVLPYLGPLFIQLNDFQIPGHGLVEIMQLRNPHHFMPSHFGWINIFLLIPVSILGLIAAYRIDRSIFYLCGGIILGCLIYIFLLPIYPELSYKTQWFKSTIWLKFFVLLMLGKWVWDSKVPMLNKFIHGNTLMLSVITKIVILTWAFRQHHSAGFNFPWSKPNYDQTVSLKAKNLSQPGDVFIVPPDFTAFKWYAQRPTWVDWKAIPHQSKCLSNWIDRIKLIYGLDTGYQGDLHTIYQKANTALQSLSQENKAYLKSQGVKFLIFKPDNDIEYLIEKL